MDGSHRGRMTERDLLAPLCPLYLQPPPLQFGFLEDQVKDVYSRSRTKIESAGPVATLKTVL